MIRATVTEIYDMNTHIGALGLIAIHTPRTNLLFKHLAGLFMQFKRFKYNGARFSLIPAAQLPQDVAGVNVGAGEQMVDPRDIFNPILHKGFTGESLGAFLDKYLDPGSSRGASLDYTIGDTPGSEGGAIPLSVDQEAAYYQMLTQGGFRKMSPMGAIRNQKIYPMVYDLATTRQLAASWKGVYEDTVDGVSDLSTPLDELEDISVSVSSKDDVIPTMRPDHNITPNGSSRSLYVGTSRYGVYGQYSDSTLYSNDPAFITPRKRKLGWMDTLQKVLPPTLGIDPLNPSSAGEVYTFTHLPKLNEYLIVTPPSYFNKLYYRLVLQHEVLFSGLRSATGASNAIDSSRVEYNNYMDQLPAAAVANSVEVLGGDVTPVTDGMASSIV